MSNFAVTRMSSAHRGWYGFKSDRPTVCVTSVLRATAPPVLP